MGSMNYPIFTGKEVPEDWLADYELFMLSMQVVNDEGKLRAIPLVLRGEAKTWLNGLEVQARTDWVRFHQAFLVRFGQRISAAEADAKLKDLRQDPREEFQSFQRQFDASWRQLEEVTAVQHGNYFKLKSFLACLHPKVREKVDLEGPNTFEEALNLACQKSKKIKRKWEQGSMDLGGGLVMPHHQQEAGDEGNARVPATQDADLVRSLQDISQQMNELRLNLFDRGRPAQQDRAQGRGGGRGRPVFGRCYNCAEEGHYAPQCPHPQRERGGIYPLFGRGRGDVQHAPQDAREVQQPVNPPIGADEGRRVNVISIDGSESEVDVMANKRTRQERGKETEEEGELRKKKGKTKVDDKPGSSKPKRKRRSICQHDFILGQGVEEYDLVKDVRSQKANITFGQVVALNSKLRRQWSKCVSTRISPKAKPKKTDALMIRVGHPADINPIIDVIMGKSSKMQAYVDGGAQVCVMTEATCKEIGAEVTAKAAIHMRMANHKRVKCLGIAQDVRVKVLGIDCMVDFYVMRAKENAYPVILGRPWLIATGADQNWETGLLVVPDKARGKKVIYDMRSKESHFHPLEEGEDSETGDDEYSSYDSDSECSTTSEEDVHEDLLKAGPHLHSISIEEIPKKKKDKSKACIESLDSLAISSQVDVRSMLGDDLTPQEKDDYVSMSEKFPKLFATGYTDLRGAKEVEHHIVLKEEAKPKVQRLRRLGNIQREALQEEVAKLLEAGFIYPVKESEWVSPVVITPKKNGKLRVCVDYKPLNAATQRDHYPLPFQDEILNQVAGHERYSIMDGFSGYFQIPIAEEDQLKTTFITPWGCYAYRRMPFGLMNAYATFQRWMNKVFAPYLGKFIRVFMDDIGCFSSRVEHLSKLELCFKRLDEEGGQLNPKKCKLAQARVLLLGHVISQNGIEADPEKVKALLLMDPPSSVQGLASFVHKLRYLSRFFWMLAQYVYPLHKLSQSVQGFVWTEEAQGAFDKIKEVLCQLPAVSPPNHEDVFYVSLSVGTVAFGAVLLQKHEKSLKPIYFESKIKSPSEMVYTEMEQWVYALVFACRKFKVYLLPKKFMVLTSSNMLPDVVLHLKPGKCIMKWVLELQEYEFDFQVDHTKKAQLADVLVNKEVDMPSYPRVAEAKYDEEPDIGDAFTLWFDGAYRRVLQRASGGVVIQDPQGEVIFKKAYDLDDVHTNNEAEYLALYLGLKQCKEFGIPRLIVRGDALLVIKQLLGLWQVKKDSLKTWFYGIKKLARDFDAIQFKHVPREKNHLADALASEKLQTYVMGLQVPQATYVGREALKDVEAFFDAGQCPNSMTKTQKRRVVMKARHYTKIGEDLMVFGRDGVLRRVPFKEEIGLILRQCHDESGHQGKDQAVFLILRAGFWWPSLVRDVYYWCKTCRPCQVNGQRRLLPEPQGSIIAYDAFEKWGIDAIGPLPRSSGGKKHIVLAIDYLTRWVEAKAVREVNAKVVASFIYDQICCRFGVPLVLISDRGQGFRSELVKALVDKMGIQHRFSSPYHPQCNGLVENTNGQIIKMLTKYVCDCPEAWESSLEKCLWAYRTSYKVATHFTPYDLVYGKEAVLPLHVQMGVLKELQVHGQEKDDSLEKRIAYLQVLQMDRDRACDFYAEQSERRVKKFNEKLPEKHIAKGDLVMKYESALDFTFQTKFRKKWSGPYEVKEVFPNGTYQLAKLDGSYLRHRINGVRLKLYFERASVLDIKNVLG